MLGIVTALSTYSDIYANRVAKIPMTTFTTPIYETGRFKVFNEFTDLKCPRSLATAMSGFPNFT